MRNLKHLDHPCAACDGRGWVKHVNPRWLREVRERANLSLREVARQLNYSPAYVSDIELGRRNTNETILAFYESLVTP